jgi:hypothetical protein
MRIFFIHGFGEAENIFDKVAPHIGGEQVFINNWNELGNTPRKDINIITYAKELAAKYHITAADVVIGHSLGGWVAYYLKHVTGCRAIQIASWTNFDRVILPKLKHSTILWAMKSGLVFNRLALWFMLRKFYKEKPSAAIFKETYIRLMKGNKNNVLNQMRLILTPVPEAVTVTPDLRIHAKRDPIIRHPKTEPTITVSGDHFTLYTSPEEVYKPIMEFLAK